jgi:hypothetical protein
MKVVYIVRGYLFSWPVLRQILPFFLKAVSDRISAGKKNFLKVVYIVRGYLFPWPVLRQILPVFFEKKNSSLFFVTISERESI